MFRRHSCPLVHWALEVLLMGEESKISAAGESHLLPKSFADF